MKRRLIIFFALFAVSSCFLMEPGDMEIILTNNSDKTFSAIMKRIDNDFFELTNKEKLSCFEKYCERQN